MADIARPRPERGLSFGHPLWLLSALTGGERLDITATVVDRDDPGGSVEYACGLRAASTAPSVLPVAPPYVGDGARISALVQIDRDGWIRQTVHGVTRSGVRRLLRWPKDYWWRTRFLRYAGERDPARSA